MIRVLTAILTAVAMIAAPIQIEPPPVLHASFSSFADEPAPRPAIQRPAVPPPVLAPLPVYVRVIDWRHFSHEDIVTPACEFLNVKCEPSTYTTGVVTIVLTEEFPAIHFGFPFGDGQILGVSSGDACEGRVWAVHDSWVIAHELGHALGLPHDGTEGNLMFPYRDKGGMTLTDAQRMTIRHGAIALRQCA